MEFHSKKLCTYGSVVNYEVNSLGHFIHDINFHFTIFNFLVRFQRALNRFSNFSQTVIMGKLIFWGHNVQTYYVNKTSNIDGGQHCNIVKFKICLPRQVLLLKSPFLQDNILEIVFRYLITASPPKLCLHHTDIL